MRANGGMPTDAVVEAAYGTTAGLSPAVVETALVAACDPGLGMDRLVTLREVERVLVELQHPRDGDTLRTIRREFCGDEFA